MCWKDFPAQYSEQTEWPCFLLLEYPLMQGTECWYPSKFNTEGFWKVLSLFLLPFMTEWWIRRWASWGICMMRILYWSKAAGRDITAGSLSTSQGWQRRAEEQSSNLPLQPSTEIHYPKQTSWACQHHKLMPPICCLSKQKQASQWLQDQACCRSLHGFDSGRPVMLTPSCWNDLRLYNFVTDFV